ncbi:MAG: carbohydrate-binding family 9-like protein [Acidobacteria bacterium]|nr:carbohydrate-binding family 9-like protein [Acidobacteriota bacterium]MBI3427633.1 carbohydrate-binding family 9-like protein [Acidobacteriota bacterium]
MRRALLSLALLTTFSIALTAQVAPKEYVCQHATGKITIDGKLNEAAWRKAPATDLFVDIEGDTKPRPRFATRAKMLWDDQYFYISAELDEPHVWGTLTKRDSVIFQDNDFEVFIDPNGDRDEYYELEINALNTVWDLFLPKPYRDGGKAQDGWDIVGLKTAVQIRGTLNHPRDTDKGWTVEMALPWQALGEYAHKPAPPAEGDQWRINFSRVEWQHEIVDGKYRKVANTKEDNWVWSPQGVIDMHRPEKWGYVRFTTASTSKSKKERQ